MRLRTYASAAMAAAVIVTAGLAPTANAADQTVSGTTIGSSLAIGVPVAATFGVNLGATSEVDTSGGTVTVTAVGAWVMRASGTDGGKLAATAAGACTDSTPVLNNSLRAFATASLGNFTAASTTGSPQTLSGSAAQVASGIGNNVVTLTYRHVPSASDQLTIACPYTMTSTVALAAS